MSTITEASTPDPYSDNACAFFKLSCLNEYTTEADALCYQCCMNHVSIHLENIANAEISAEDRAHLTGILEDSLVKEEKSKLEVNQYLCLAQQKHSRDTQ